MKVFISWSGEFSQAVASLLKKYLPTIIQDLEAFVSSHDIETGMRWASKLTLELDSTNFGIICLSSINIKSPWILFEAGALSKFEDSSLCCLLIGGLKPTDISTPLSQFQNCAFEKNSFRKLILDINKRRSSPLESERFNLLFDAFWPKIEEEYQSLCDIYNKAPNKLASERGERDLLEEILFRVRSLERDSAKFISYEELSFENILDQKITMESLKAYTEMKFPGKGISEHWQGAMLRDIRSTDYPTLRYVDDAINKALPAVEKYQSKQPNLFQTGTDLITKSLGFVDPDFRKRHSFGERTIKAFNEFSHLVKP